ncbi:MAG: hypothetical protein NW223_16305 [Hyphomicrobiaceae bacterium]|nr:hypothetical protein [Hyphomicrobiaceae bacterium]
MAASDEPLTEARRDGEETWLPKAATLTPAQGADSPAEKASFGDWVRSVVVGAGRAPA